MVKVKVELDVGKPINFLGLTAAAQRNNDTFTDTLGIVTLSKVYNPSGKEVDFKGVHVPPKDGMSSIRTFILAGSQPLMITVDHQLGSGKVDCPIGLKGYVAEFELSTFNSNRRSVPTGILG